MDLLARCARQQKLLYDSHKAASDGAILVTPVEKWVWIRAKRSSTLLLCSWTVPFILGQSLYFMQETFLVGHAPKLYFSKADALFNSQGLFISKPEGKVE